MASSLVFLSSPLPPSSLLLAQSIFGLFFFLLFLLPNFQYTDIHYTVLLACLPSLALPCLLARLFSQLCSLAGLARLARLSHPLACFAYSLFSLTIHLSPVLIPKKFPRFFFFFFRLLLLVR